MQIKKERKKHTRGSFFSHKKNTRGEEEKRKRKNIGEEQERHERRKEELLLTERGRD